MRPLKKTGIRQLKKQLTAERPAVDLVFLLQALDDPVNVGALFRIADASGAKELVLVGETPAPPHPGISLTARGCDRRVAWRREPHIEDAISALRANGYQLVGVELSDNAVDYTAFEFAEKVCLILGNEGAGVWPKTLRLCDGAVFIPMYGKGPSLNVHVSAALVAWEVLRRGRVQGAESSTHQYRSRTKT